MRRLALVHIRAGARPCGKRRRHVGGGNRELSDPAGQDHHPGSGGQRTRRAGAHHCRASGPALGATGSHPQPARRRWPHRGAGSGQRAARWLYALHAEFIDIPGSARQAREASVRPRPRFRAHRHGRTGPACHRRRAVTRHQFRAGAHCACERATWRHHVFGARARNPAARDKRIVSTACGNRAQVHLLRRNQSGAAGRHGRPARTRVRRVRSARRSARDRNRQSPRHDGAGTAATPSSSPDSRRDPSRFRCAELVADAGARRNPGSYHRQGECRSARCSGAAWPAGTPASHRATRSARCPRPKSPRSSTASGKNGGRSWTRPRQTRADGRRTHDCRTTQSDDAADGTPARGASAARRAADI